MFGLRKEKISIDCPQCGAHHTLSLEQVTLNASIYCACGANIQLDDKGGSVRNSTRAINEAFRDLENTLRQLEGR